MINNALQVLNIDVFDILKHRHTVFKDLKLCVDAGAAAGMYSKRILDINPDAELYAYEPFPGNWVHLETTLQPYKTVQIVKKALSNKQECRKLFVSSVVETGNTSFARNLLGYSSVGTFWGSSASKCQMFDVECTTVDSELPDKQISFFKIDVQGAETLVLNGSAEALRRGIDMLFIEFSFQPGLLPLLKGYEYVCFDTEYLFTSGASPARLLEAGFTAIQPLQLSTGQTAYKANYQGDYSHLQSQDFKSQLAIGFCQTDLICVSKDYLRRFFSIIANHPHSIEQGQ